MAVDSGEITQLLHLWCSGDRDAEDRLFTLLLPDLRRLAGHYLRRERTGHTLQPTALVNEAFIRLAAAKNVDWQDRGHFLAITARIMRRHLIDHARGRPDADLLPVEALPSTPSTNHTRLELAVAVDSLLNELGKESPQRCSVVELKFFLGLSDEEAADSIGLKVHTFQREWYRARCWLFERLNSEPWKHKSIAISRS